METPLTLRHPLRISARLLPGIRVAPGHWISWDPAKGVGHIDTPEFEHDVTDLRPGLSGRTGSPESRIAASLGALCAFLGACAESRKYALHRHGDPMKGEHSDLFPENVGEWAEMHSDELDTLSFELEHPEE